MLTLVCDELGSIGLPRDIKGLFYGRAYVERDTRPDNLQQHRTELHYTLHYDEHGRVQCITTPKGVHWWMQD